MLRSFSILSVLFLVSLAGCGDDASTPDAAVPTDGATASDVRGTDSSMGAPDSDVPVDMGPPPADSGSSPVGRNPRDGAQVYFVGHSLISHIDYFHEDVRSIPDLVGALAGASDLGYGSFVHTAPGAALSWNWNGEVGQRTQLEDNAGSYDTMVVTEAIFLEAQYSWNSSPFYARRFFCTLANARPDAELFVYETWHHLYASDPDGEYGDPHVWDWSQRLRDDRANWNRIVDEAASGDTPTPDEYYDGAGACEGALTIRLIPAGAALLALATSMARGDDWGGLTMDQLIHNGYQNWPTDWPVPASEAGSVDWRGTLAGLNTFYAGEPDDIHHGGVMGYFVSLVMYATIYRRTPVGLPALNGVDGAVAQRMQALVWDVVLSDPRSGVSE